jgi:hypothetical protein
VGWTAVVQIGATDTAQTTISVPFQLTLVETRQQAARPESDVGESNHYLMKPWRRDFITQRRKLGVHSHPVRRLFFPFHCVTTAFQHSLPALIGLYFVEITLRGTTRNQLQNNYRGPE